MRGAVGAVGSQNITDPTLGPRLLDLMALGATAAEAVRIVAGSAAHITFRQLLAVDAAGRTGVFSGSRTLGTYAAAEGDGAAAAGNMLRSKVVPERMLSTFVGSAGSLGGRLLAAMRAGITTVLLPERNRKDYDEVPEAARNAMKFVWLSTVDDAIAAAF